MIKLPLWLIWFIAGLILIVMEIFTPGFVISLIGLACLITGISAIITNNIIIHIIVFSTSIILMMFFLRPIFLKYFYKKNPKKSNVDALIGKQVIVDSDIDNNKNKGYIKIGADYFKAISEDGSNIPKGTLVVIKKMEGITATVSKSVSL